MTSTKRTGLTFEQSIIASLVDLERSRVTSKMEIELAHLHAEAEERAEARADARRARHEFSEILIPLVQHVLPILVTRLTVHAEGPRHDAGIVKLTSNPAASEQA